MKIMSCEISCTYVYIVFITYHSIMKPLDLVRGQCLPNRKEDASRDGCICQSIVQSPSLYLERNEISLEPLSLYTKIFLHEYCVRFHDRCRWL